jgi:hypothetical protein
MSDFELSQFLVGCLTVNSLGIVVEILRQQPNYGQALAEILLFL